MTYRKKLVSDELPEFNKKVFVFDEDSMFAAKRTSEAPLTDGETWYWRVNTTGDLLYDDDYTLYYLARMFTHWATFPEFEEE